MLHTLQVAYVEGVGNATIAGYEDEDTLGIDAEFGADETTEIHYFPTDKMEMRIYIAPITDFIVESNEFFRLNITFTTSDGSSPPTCLEGDAEQYRCTTDIFILDDDCKSWHML